MVDWEGKTLLLIPIFMYLEHGINDCEKNVLDSGSINWRIGKTKKEDKVSALTEFDCTNQNMGWKLVDSLHHRPSFQYHYIPLKKHLKLSIELVHVSFLDSHSFQIKIVSAGTFQGPYLVWNTFSQNLVNNLAKIQ